VELINKQYRYTLKIKKKEEYKKKEKNILKSCAKCHT